MVLPQIFKKEPSPPPLFEIPEYSKIYTVCKHCCSFSEMSAVEIFAFFLIYYIPCHILYLSGLYCIYKRSRNEGIIAVLKTLKGMETSGVTTQPHRHV